MTRVFRVFGAVALVLSVIGVLGTAAGADRRVRTLTSRDAVLQPPAVPLTKLLAPVQGCQVLLDAGTGDCAVVNRRDGAFVFTVESGPTIDDVLASRPWTVRVYRPSATVPDGWEVALQAPVTEGYTGALFADVSARVADVTGDDEPEVLFGYRSEGTGHILDLDVVGFDSAGAPSVLAHEQLYRGTVLVKSDRLVTFTPVYRRADGNCCPTWIERGVVKFEDGAFRVHPGKRTPTERTEVPPGDFA